MKKLFLSLFAFLLALSVPAEMFAQAKKSAVTAKSGTQDSAFAWTKKAKDLNKKNVSTLVAEIDACGIAQSDAPFVVVPVLTATAKKQEGGKINVLIPFAAFEKFHAQYAPKIAEGGTAFGAKSILKPISGTFFLHQSEPVLLVGVKVEALEKAPKASEQLAAQIAAEDEASGATKSSKEGYTKKFFYVSKIAKDRKAKAEFARLMALYNKGKKRDERVKPADAQALLEDGGDSYIVFEDAKKIEWEIRK